LVLFNDVTSRMRKPKFKLLKIAVIQKAQRRVFSLFDQQKIPCDPIILFPRRLFFLHAEAFFSITFFLCCFRLLKICDTSETRSEKFSVLKEQYIFRSDHIILHNSKYLLVIKNSRQPKSKFANEIRASSVLCTIYTIYIIITIIII